jgi:ParB-like chromosome segregation protein Spo0J
MEKLNIAAIKPNEENPRFITDAKFKKLVKSIKDFPEMLEARPLVIDEDNIVLGGNMRLKALKAAGVFEIPVKRVVGWTEQQKKEFIIKDNIGYGEWDWDLVANGWEAEQLEDWGLDVPNFGGNDEDLLGENISENEIFKIQVALETEEKQNQLYQELLAKGYDCKRSN